MSVACAFQDLPCVLTISSFHACGAEKDTDTNTQHNTAAFMQALKASGIDCESLAALAVSDVAALNERLKALGITTIGARAKVKAELLAVAGAAAPRLVAEPLTAQSSVSQPSAASSSSSRMAPWRVVVVHNPCVFVRERPDARSESLARKMHGDDFLVVGEETPSGWLKLHDAEGWVLRDGSQVGLGVLLRALPPPPLPPPPDLPPLAVMATDGLGNRLRVVLSFARIARERGRPLLVQVSLSPRSSGPTACATPSGTSPRA